jgi:hypothetical protein
VDAGRVWETAFLGGLLMRESIPDHIDGRTFEVRRTIANLQTVQLTDLSGRDQMFVAFKRASSQWRARLQN